jgi:ribonucleoside-diphosphate reductase alpha chain
MSVSGQELFPTAKQNGNGVAAIKIAKTKTRKSLRGRGFSRRFSDPLVHPFDQIPWELRDCLISDSAGKAIFEQKGVEVPASWSQMATTVVASKYLYGAVNTPERESGVRKLISRVVFTITEWGKSGNYFGSAEDAKTFANELTFILLHQYAAFNSPVWFNVGIRPAPQCSACFIVPVEDSLDSLLQLQTTEARLFKYGSGTGTNFSSVRSSRDPLSGGGVPSGPVSFMRAFDAWAGTIKSGGKTRRAAKMLMLDVTHPDILEFITCKRDEEKKAWALSSAGYDQQIGSRGGAYDSVSFQNANLSVRANDQFMNAAMRAQKYFTKYVSTGLDCTEYEARDVLKLIAQATHMCGDPGLQFDTTINAWHTCPANGPIRGSNPCSEFMHVDNTACNLASINLLKFLSPDNTFDCDGFRHTVDILGTAQDILIENSGYPTPEIEKNSHVLRPIGLGYTNLGATLTSLGLAYDSSPARSFAAAITSLMTGQAYLTSSKLAETLEPFAAFEINRTAMLGVLEKHRAASTKIERGSLPAQLAEQVKEVWNDALAHGQQFGYRNSQTTVLAPTGTISFMLDCDTTGIEPDLGLIKYKKLAGGGMLKLVNQSVSRGLKSLGYTEEDTRQVNDWIEQHGSIEGCPQMKDEDLSVFDCALRSANSARCISYKGHLTMMAAVQPFLSGAISKTVNLPAETTAEEICDVYIEAWKLGLKSVALYRDGSKVAQPLTTSDDSKVAQPKPVRRKLPAERPAITHRFSVAGLKGYLTVGMYDDTKMPGEIFLVMAKEGSTVSGVMDAFATAVSLALQYGVPLGALVKKFSHMRFEPSGFTGNPDLPMAKSIIDYVFRWLALHFLPETELSNLGIARASSSASQVKVASAESQEFKGSPNASVSEDAPPCTNCGSSLMVRQGSCYVCLNCGTQGGCG